MHYLSVSTIVKNEYLYLKEWVEFYLKQGVDHFYLYDNTDDILHAPVVEEYSDKITWHKFPGRVKQRAACDHTILNYQNDSEFILFCDVDEFVLSSKDSRFVDTLKRDYDQQGISAIAVHWLLFGSNGHIKKTDEPVTKRFTRRAEGVNPHVKSIVRMKHTYSMGNNVHTFRVKGMIIDENFACQPEEYAVVSPATADILKMAHFVTKSKEECDIRRAQPRCDTGEMRSSDFFLAHDCNDIEDRSWADLV